MPNTVGIAQKRKFPPPFIRSTKNNISISDATPARIHFNRRLFVDISGTTVSAATSIIEAVTTENTPKPIPVASCTINVMTIGSMRIAAITTPALYAALRSFFACLSSTPFDSFASTSSTLFSCNSLYIFWQSLQPARCFSTKLQLASLQALS